MQISKKTIDEVRDLVVGSGAVGVFVNYTASRPPVR